MEYMKFVPLQFGRCATSTSGDVRRLILLNAILKTDFV
jgi:hypothetical protein